MDWTGCNGTLVKPYEQGAMPDRLLTGNYVYQHIHTYDHRVLHSEAHIGLLRTALRALYGAELRLDADALQRHIGELLRANRYPRGSNCVTVRVYPHGVTSDSEEPEWQAEVTAQLLYPRYVLWHSRLMLDVLRCDNPFPGYPTGSSRLVAAYARERVRRAGADIAAVENGRGVLTGVDDEPLFVVLGRQVLSTPLTDGAADSVLRRLVLRLCRTLGLTTTEYPLTRELLLRADEAFTVNVQGVVPILGFGSKRYYNLAADRISRRINGAIL